LALRSKSPMTEPIMAILELTILYMNNYLVVPVWLSVYHAR
jgi:hypothetical protein